jgi:hypothetical protein
MEEEVKAKCKVHHMLVESFCGCRTCLLPLCRKCLPQHEAFHASQHTSARLLLMRDCVHNAKKSLGRLAEELLQVEGRVRHAFQDELIRRVGLVKQELMDLLAQSI